MKRITVDSSRAAYDAATDTLFLSLGDYDPTMLSGERAYPDGTVVQYSYPDGIAAFVEVPRFSKRGDGAPFVLEIGAPDDISIAVPGYAVFGGN